MLYNKFNIENLLNGTNILFPLFYSTIMRFACVCCVQCFIRRREGNITCVFTPHFGFLSYILNVKSSRFYFTNAFIKFFNQGQLENFSSANNFWYFFMLKMILLLKTDSSLKTDSGLKKTDSSHKKLILA